MSKKDNKIAKELIAYKFTGKETLEDLHNIFAKIMKKNKISRTTPSYNEKGKKVGELGNRFEWTLYKTLWLSCIELWFVFHEWLV